jgi:hypothetical protein
LSFTTPTPPQPSSSRPKRWTAPSSITQWRDPRISLLLLLVLTEGPETLDTRDIIQTEERQSPAPAGLSHLTRKHLRSAPTWPNPSPPAGLFF